jgi:hypothetical protein
MKFQGDAECVRLATGRVGCTMMVSERLVMTGMEVVTRVVSGDRKGGRKGGEGGGEGDLR